MYSCHPMERLSLPAPLHHRDIYSGRIDRADDMFAVSIT